MTKVGINHDYFLKMKVLTPIHVGGTQEKHLVEGLDYIKDGKSVYILDQQKLLDKLDMYILSEALLSGQKDNLLRALQSSKINPKEVSSDVFQVDEDYGSSEIKAFIKEGMYGKPYVPGSSLKGALRSHLFASLKAQNQSEDSVLGKFQQSILRHIKIGDAFFEELKLLPCKTFNLRSDRNSWVGGWRHGTNNTTNRFTNNQAVFVYECLPAGKEANLNIRILDHESSLFQKHLDWDRKESLEKGKPLPSKFQEVIKADPLENLFEMINVRTRKFLTKEIAFFKAYQVPESMEILKTFDKILKYIPTGEAARQYCVMRMGHGSGFHSITGDWQYPTEYTNPNDVHQGGKNHGKKKYKSRKLLFEAGRFYPMGFLALAMDGITLGEWGETSTTKTEPIVEKAPASAAYFKGVVKRETQLDAVVVKSGPPNMVEVYLQGDNKITLPLLGYRAPLEEDKVIIVKVQNINKKGEVTEVGFVKSKS
jgi:CRISPR/Cas system CSM-associated protein Csm5 (group 7 of RAMP superfamily)